MNALKPSKNMDMERALLDARRLYTATHDSELKEVLDRAELCWGKWRDASEYHALVRVCADVKSHMF
jgi:hypothetical protein